MTTYSNIDLPWTRFLQPFIDIVIHVDGKPFPANKSLLMQHSGYFRTVLTPTTTTLVLPTVPADIFSLLWTSMASNSGLNLTETNVYQLLLYGQLLQMPTVVLQCKAYLTSLQQQQQQHVEQPQQPLRPPITSTIVRPIPNKIQLWKPWMYSASLYQDWLTRLASNSAAQLEPAQFLNFPAMSQHSDTTTPPNENSTSEQDKKLKKQKNKKKPKDLNLLNVATEDPDENSENLVDISLEDDQLDSVKAIDVAACDGPVRFHRILNPILMEDDDNPNPEDPVDVVGGHDNTSNMSEDNSTQSLMGTNVKSRPESAEGSSSGATYKCLFCNHIFKSHYCYQKHKRRHLNPFTVDFTLSDCSNTNNSISAAGSSSSGSASTNCISAKKPNSTAPPSTTLKDINVQFFPCKICGAKFPSYYFVHKHKKIWHPEAVANETLSIKSTSSS